MRRRCAVVLLLGGFVQAAGAQRLATEPHGGNEDPARAVLRTDSLRLAAVLRRDVAAVERILDPRWLLISSVTGERLTRDAYLAGLASGARQIRAAEHDSVVVRVFGSAAVVTGRSTAALVRADSATNVVTWFTHVYVRADGDWRMVSMHVSADRPR